MEVIDFALLSWFPLLQLQIINPKYKGQDKKSRTPEKKKRKEKRVPPRCPEASSRSLPSWM